MILSHTSVVSTHAGGAVVDPGVTGVVLVVVTGVVAGWVVSGASVVTAVRIGQVTQQSVRTGACRIQRRYMFVKLKDLSHIIFRLTTLMRHRAGDVRAISNNIKIR